MGRPPGSGIGDGRRLDCRTFRLFYPFWILDKPDFAVLPFCGSALIVLLPHPFAYMGFTRQKIGKQLLLGLLTAVILYPVCMAISLLIRQPVVPEGYRISFSLRLLNQSGSLIASQAVSILLLSVPEDLFRGYFQNRLVFFHLFRYARWIIQAVNFRLVSYCQPSG